MIELTPEEAYKIFPELKEKIKGRSDFISHRTPTWNGFEKVKHKVLRGKVLEVGCAGGEFHHAFRPLGFEWYGIDIKGDLPFPSPDPNSYSTCDMQDLKYFKENEFTLVFACHSFEHIENPIKALKEFYRVLKDGGCIFISMPRFCEKQILKMDDDHISILHPWQTERYCKYLTVRCNIKMELMEQFEELMNPPNKEDGQDSQIYLIKVTKN